MKTNIKQEILLFFIAILPFIFLFIVWNKLPQEVAIHYNFEGEADRFSSKNSFILLSGMGLFVYFMLLIVPAIDPKKQIEKMGNKFFMVKFITLFLVSGIMCFIIYKTVNTDVPIQFMMVILGLFFAALGNYFQTIKPNYFLGIRTPWTLHSDEVWLKTHRKSGKIWIAGGLLMALSYFIFPLQSSSIIMISITIILAIAPIILSYLFYKKETLAN